MPLPPAPISILDVEIKSNNLKKVQWIDANNIVHEEYVTAEEFNIMVETIKSNYIFIERLKKIRDRSEDVIITAAHLSATTMAQITLQEEPLKDRHVFLYCMGLLISKNNYNIDGKTLKISQTTLEYSIEVGDVMTIMYTYLNKNV